MWYIHATKYFSALKRHEVLTHATIWINLIHGISQSQKDSCYVIQFIQGTYTGQIYGSRRLNNGCHTSQGGREEKLGINV